MRIVLGRLKFALTTSLGEKVVFTVKCPECGGDFRYDRQSQRYICRDCGLTMTREEFNQSFRRKPEKINEREALRRDYLKWWLSKKE